MNSNVNSVKGYDGSIHAPSSEVGSKVKIEGHKKEGIFANRIGGEVITGRKPDVLNGEYRYSVKGADESIQFLSKSRDRSIEYYGIGHPMSNFSIAGYNHRKFKLDNNNYTDNSLFSKYKESADKVAEWLQNKDNFRFVLEKAISDGYDANKLVILLKEKGQDTYQDAFVYDMREVIDLYVNSDYKIHVTEGIKKRPNSGAKVVVTCEGFGEIFYLEIRGGPHHCGELKHGVTAKQLYFFLKENLNYEVISE